MRQRPQQADELRGRQPLSVLGQQIDDLAVGGVGQEAIRRGERRNFGAAGELGVGQDEGGRQRRDIMLSDELAREFPIPAKPNDIEDCVDQRGIVLRHHRNGVAGRVSPTRGIGRKLNMPRLA